MLDGNGLWRPLVSTYVQLLASAKCAVSDIEITRRSAVSLSTVVLAAGAMAHPLF